MVKTETMKTKEFTREDQVDYPNLAGKRNDEDVTSYEIKKNLIHETVKYQWKGYTVNIVSECGVP